MCSFPRSKTIDLEQNNSLAKLPLLKQGEYDIWRLGIESLHFQTFMTHSLWEIIEEGNTFQAVVAQILESQMHLLLLSINTKVPKSLFEASEARFVVNEATKKTQKTLLKQMYETFSASSSESLDSIFNRLQEIVSQLTILGMSVVVWRNKYCNGFNKNWPLSQVIAVTANDGYIAMFMLVLSAIVHCKHESKNFYQRTGFKKIGINGRDYCLGSDTEETAQGGTNECREEASPKAMLAIDGTGFDWSYMAQEEASTNFAPYNLKTQYDKLRVELRKSESDLSNYKRGLASVEERLVFYKKNESMLNDQIVVLKRDASYKDSDINGLEKQVERLKKEKEENQFKIDNYENASKSLDQMIGNQLVGNNKKGLGYNTVPPPLTGLFAPPSVDLSSSGIEKFKEPEFEGYGVKVTKSASENVSKEVKKTSDAPIIEDWVSDCDEDETVVLESLNVQKPKQADQPRKVSQNPRNNSTSWNTPKPKKLGVGFQFTPKACFVCGSFNHLIKDCDFHDKKMVQKPVLNNVKKVTGQREVRPVWTNAMRVNHQNFSNSKRNFAPKAVLTKSGLIPVSAARPINTAVHKPFANVAKPRTNVFQKAHSSLRRPFYQQTVLKNRNLSNQVNTANVISVNTVGKQGINAVKPTAYWAWRPKVKMINHVYKNTGFCVCKQFDYVDPTGRNKVLNSPYFMVKSWLVQDQTVLGQTATGKESSNPFMAGSLPKTISPMIHISQEVILLKEERTINMLVDKKYPLKKEILKKMINLKIEAEEESDMASELIKFIKSQIAEQS
ncbi:hypothetical protein Tco_1041958 [Tanacetum coccineum]|uniref:Uncharacterized protein n=1 Tax=Tanacetum coccineum TaxID=301880 RepID=A0ABQ5GKB9_9ASTR